MDIWYGPDWSWAGSVQLPSLSEAFSILWPSERKDRDRKRDTDACGMPVTADYSWRAGKCFVCEQCMGQQSVESKLCSVIRTNLPLRNENPTVSIKGVVSFDHLLHILSAFEMAEANVVGIPNCSAFSPINASRLAIPPKDHKHSLQSACQQLTVVAAAILRSDLCVLFNEQLPPTISCRLLSKRPDRRD